MSASAMPGLLVEKRAARDRGKTEWGWLHSRHTFSFGDYYDLNYSGFRTLLVINDGSSVTIQPASGNEVEISVEAFTSSNCRAQGRLVVPAAAGATPPPIQLGNADVCPIGPGSASVPDGLGSYFWSIQNGTIEWGGNNSTVFYRANGQGPVRLSVTIDNPGSCPMVSTATVPLRETTPPVIELDAPDICPLGPGSAYVFVMYLSQLLVTIISGLVAMALEHTSLRDALEVPAELEQPGR